MASRSRQLAQWVVGLRYDDLSAEVVDRAKGVTLHGLASVLLGSLTPGGRQAVKLISSEEAGVTSSAGWRGHGEQARKWRELVRPYPLPADLRDQGTSSGKM